MWRLERFGVNFSSTAEIATGLLLLGVVVAALFALV